ncbi:MAG TPA: tetratricopeptide repeat protein [Pirellulales bacterium]|jgi:tetratricopeptide (TPR) repeat protein
MRWIWLAGLACVCATLAPSDASAQLFGGRFRMGATRGADPRAAPRKFPSAPKEPEQWIGMKVMPRKPTAAFGLQDHAIGHASDVSPWPQTVRKAQGSWLWLEAPGAQGWINIQDVVPLADAVLYFNELLARRQTAWEFYMRGSALRELERFNETYADFKALEAIEEKQLKALSAQATAQLMKKDYRALIATANQMERLSPSNVTIFTTRGGAYLMLQDVTRAKADYDHAVELAASTITYAARARFYRQQDDLERAIEDFDKAIYHWPLIRLYEERAECLLDHKEYARAIEDLNVALAADPNKVDNYLLRGQANLASGHVYQANLDFSTAIQLSPTAETYLQTATARYMCDEFRRAIDDASIAIRLNPRLSTAYLIRGDSHSKLQRHAEALADLDRAIQINPKETQAYVQRGQLSFKLKNPDQALRDGVEAYRLGSRSKSCVLLTGLGYISQGKAARSVELLDEALREDPTFSQAYALRSAAYWVVGDNAQAKADAIEAKLYSTSETSSGVTLTVTTDIFATPPIESRTAIFLSDFGMSERAIAVATEVISQFPERSGGYYARGLARFRLLNYDGAREDLRAAIERNPRDAEAHRRLGDCDLKQDRFEEAIVDATHLLVLEGPSFIVFLGRAWAWRECHEPELVVEDASDALTYSDDANPKKVAECYLLRSEAHKKLGRQELYDADRQRAEGIAKAVVRAWDEMLRKEDREQKPSLFVHAADGENLRSSSKTSGSAKTSKTKEPWEDDFSLRAKSPDAGKKWPKLGTPSAYR